MATITLLIIFSILNFILIPSFSCPLYQKQVLLDFKSNFITIFNISHFDYYNPIQSWSPESDCCSWDGVSCSNTKTVIELHLSDINPLLADSTTLFFDIFTPIFHIRSLEQLDISGNHLAGEIPGDGFGNLTELVHLDMSSNMFNGSIPNQIFGLTKLCYLDMSDSFSKRDLGFELGGSFWNLTSLQVLALSNNMLNGVLSPEVGKLRYLESLDLRMNSLFGNIPEEIGNLTKLRQFYLADNQFSGGIPSSIAVNMMDMEVLDFSHNSLSKQIPANIGSLANITTLDLNNNQLTGPIPFSIRNLSNLQVLWLQKNKLTGEIPTWIFNITTLASLFLGGGKGNKLIWNNNAKIVPTGYLRDLSMPSCGISGQIPEWISSQEGLFLLDLSGNKLEGRFPNWLVEMDLETIILFDNKLSGSIPHRLFESTTLMILHLSRNNFSGKLPDNIGNTTHMVVLMLSGNNLSGQVPISMSKLHNLQLLDLSRNKFSGNNIPGFTDNPDFFYLDLSYNEFSGYFQDVLPRSPFLQVLVLRNNSFEGFIPTTISNFTNLQILDLSGNKLGGSIPLEIGNLTKMIETPVHLLTSGHYSFKTSDYSDSQFKQTQIDIEDLIVNWKNYLQGLSSHSLDIYSFLDLSNNKISGEIPASLGNLKSLKVLNISNNNISEHIPVSFGNLKGIESLDLSHNKISGSIPQSLENLDGLGILDVSNNMLTGKIPIGGHMSTMNEIKFFANNSGLCGMQIHITCPEDIPPSEEEIGDDDEKLSWMFWEGTWIGFPIGFFSSILIMGYLLNFLLLFKFW